jgi:chromosome segregation ATPase
VSFVFIPMAQSPRQKIVANVSRIKAPIPMINNELKRLQSRRKRLIENISNIADDIVEIDKELGRLESDQGEVRVHEYGIQFLTLA